MGLLGRFDTGDWSRYELGGGYAKRNYQEFVTELLGKLASKTEDPFWQDAATRFVNYTYEPPEVTQNGPPDPPVAYPRPLDGWLDTVQIPVTLSKKASLTLVVAGRVLTWSKQARGDHVLTWKPGPDIPPGTYPVTVRAVDFRGRAASYPLQPVAVAWDTEPPHVTAQVDPATNELTWSTTDAGTPWLRDEPAADRSGGRAAAADARSRTAAAGRDRAARDSGGDVGRRPQRDELGRAAECRTAAVAGRAAAGRRSAAAAGACAAAAGHDSAGLDGPGAGRAAAVTRRTLRRCAAGFQPSSRGCSQPPPPRPISRAAGPELRADALRPPAASRRRSPIRTGTRALPRPLRPQLPVPCRECAAGSCF